MDTVIIANRRYKNGYWEGYRECTQAEAVEWKRHFKATGQIIKVFPGMMEYRADCTKLLDRLEAMRKKKHERTGK